MEFFPYQPRPTQERIVSFIDSHVSKGKSVVIESGTGTGKTICSLAGVLPFALASERKVIYLTRTKSQQKQVISELRSISRERSVFGIGIQGRSVNTCPIMAENKELIYGTADEMSRLCSQMKRKNKSGICGCAYYQRIMEFDPGAYVLEVREGMPDPENFQERCIKDGLCPYEMAKLVIPYADVVAVPYIFVVTPMIRQRLLDWMNTSIEDTIMIIDEAHNLPDYLRDSCTSEYTARALDYVEKEANEFKDPEVANGIAVSDVVTAMRNCFFEASVEYLKDDDGLIPFGFMQEYLMSELCVPSTTLNSLFKNMVEFGETVREERKSRMKLPRSYIGNLGLFLQFWMSCDDECYVRLINGGESPSFEAYCMDPFEAASPFRECHASVHMSGTLEPLDEYVAELGLRNPGVRVFDSPFDPDNLLTLFVEDVTTRHKDLQIDPENIDRIYAYIVEIVNGIGRNIAVFFPSYDMMDRFVNKGLTQDLGAEVYSERRGMNQGELMQTVDNFRTSVGAVLFAVTGGRVSEGLDFPSKDLEVAIIVGLPYPRPSFKKEALIRYTDLHYGNGWESVVKSPMSRKMRQARGRLIRSETDRGVAIVLDSRASQIRGFGAVPTRDAVKDANDFFDQVVKPSEFLARRLLELQ